MAEVDLVYGAGPRHQGSAEGGRYSLVCAPQGRAGSAVRGHDSCWYQGKLRLSEPLRDAFEAAGGQAESWEVDIGDG